LYRRASAWSLTAVDFVVDDLPGIGRRYQMMGINGGRITVVVHHSVVPEVNREDWGLTWNAALETGGFLLSKSVRLEIEAELVRK
jgi:hypothetical protein